MLVRNSPQFGVDMSSSLPRDFHIKQQVICKEVSKEFPVKHLNPPYRMNPVWAQGLSTKIDSSRGFYEGFSVKPSSFTTEYRNICFPGDALVFPGFWAPSVLCRCLFHYGEVQYSLRP